MPGTDWFNEAVITAMLAAGAEDAGIPGARGAALTESGPLMPPAGGQGARGAALMESGPLMPPAGGQGAAPDDAEALTQAPNLRARLLSLLDEARRRAVADGFPPEYAETADFAICAFIDETLLSSGWSGRSEWMARPLQLERHDTGTAGEDFYRLLDDLLTKAGSAPALGLPAPGAPASGLPAPGLPAPGAPAPGLPAPGAPASVLPAPGALPGLARSASAGGAASPPANGAQGNSAAARAQAPFSRVHGLQCPEESSTAARAQAQLLEIFALCLAQGFTGMYFHDPDAVRSYLRKIGQLVPAVGAELPPENNSLFFPAAGAAPRAPSSLMLRFDLLDWLLWLAPLGITGAIHYLCGSRLDAMLTGLLQRSALP